MWRTLQLLPSTAKQQKYLSFSFFTFLLFYLLKFVSYSQQEGSAILISSHDGLIALLTLILQIALVHGLQVSLALGIEQIVCLEEDGDAVLELLLGTQDETEHSLIPLVGILEGRNQGELGTREGRGQLRIPAILRILI